MRSTSTATDSGPVREFFVANAGYWIDEYHMDGLRLDATQQIFDASPRQSIAEVGRRCARRRTGRAVIRRRRERAAGYATWCGRRARAAWARRPVERRLPPQRDGGADRPGRSLLQRHLGDAAGVHRRGQVRLSVPGAALQLAAPAARDARPGSRAGAFVAYLQNHDQVANSVRGLRDAPDHQPWPRCAR